jgi:T5SS/PEP-CTERM-associated repeat protein
MLIAQDLNSVGVVTVDGTGSDLNSSSGMQIGNSGQAIVTVTNGGELSSTFAEIGGLVGITSFVTIDGPDSRWHTTGIIEVGDAGDAALAISNVGKVQSGTGALADAADATTSATITGAGSKWEMNGSGTFYVGEDGTGTLRILEGGSVSNVEGHVGYDVGSTGTVLVDGAGSTWTNSGDLTVGRDGDGTLDITGGGLVQNSNGYIGRSVGNGGDSMGAVTVNGAGSTWTNSNFVYVGYDNGGEGSLSVEAGGTVTCTTGFVGNVAGSHGTAIVDGLGSKWTTSGTLAVGDGALTISNSGAVVTNGLFGTLAAESTSDAEVTVVGQGSSWSLVGALLTVGFGGTAAVNILNGGNVASFDARVAADAGSNGTVLVSGAGSTWTIGRRLGVGGDAGSLVSGGTATLNIHPGGTVNVAQNIVIFAGGLLRLEGGTLDAATVSFNGGGTFNFLSGTLHVGTYNGSLVNQGGTLAPGHSAGTTTIAGSYAQQAAGALAIEIGGTAPGSTYDVVNISSIAGISGQLQLALLNGFVPSASNTFTVLTAASGVFGTFANVANGERLATSDGLGSFLVNYGPGSAFTANQIVLSAFQEAALPGDFNLDGKVDAADYVKWRKGLGTNYTPAHYNTWRAHFGETAGSGTDGFRTTAVPEPASIVMLIMGILPICFRQRRAVVP